MDELPRWNHVGSFVAVAEAGSLSAAARRLGVSQPTLSRHIEALERQLGVRLFDRTATGLSLTPTGGDLVEHGRAMQRAAERFSLVAAGRSEAVAGTVRITASQVVSTFVLPPLLTELHRLEPEIEIELVADDASGNLLQREADVAVRMYRPTQLDLIARHLGDVPVGMFASREYVSRHGAPRSFEEALEHSFIGYDRNEVILKGFRALGHEVDRQFFAFRCDDQVVCWSMVKAGFGIGFNQARIGRDDPDVVPILDDQPLPILPVWLATHPELSTSRRIRRVYEFLTDALRRWLSG